MFSKPIQDAKGLFGELERVGMKIFAAEESFYALMSCKCEVNRFGP